MPTKNTPAFSQALMAALYVMMFASSSIMWGSGVGFTILLAKGADFRVSIPYVYIQSDI